MDAKWSGDGWHVGRKDEVVILTHQRNNHVFHLTPDIELGLKRSWLRWFVVGNGERYRLKGLPAREARPLRTALAHARLATDITAAVEWVEEVSALLAWGNANQRWIPREPTDALQRARPAPSLTARVRTSGELWEALSEDERARLDSLDRDLYADVAAVNNATFRSVLMDESTFFQSVEKSPLTAEQSRAVVCMDNRVLVVASAGSGKTSVMVARAAYAVQRGFVAPERILLLAFNRAAAAELQERVDAAVERLDLDASGIRASTFHKFGLDTIGRLTGEKPRLAPWVDGGQDREMVSRIVDELRDESREFRFKWDLYRILFAGTPEDPEEAQPDSYDRETRETGFRTARGETVKSHGERFIADWLFTQGVDYAYEKAYAFPVADSAHSQYRPDFYYPDIDVWHEHWAVDREGRAPTAFVGYERGMQWKRDVHRRHGTTLLETNWEEIVDGTGFESLQASLEARGLTMDWNPDRARRGPDPIKHEELAGVMRTFMSHVKSNSLTRDALDNRVQSVAMGNRYRARLFLDLYWPIHEEWQRRLAAEHYVDFDDMLLTAARLLAESTEDPGYDMVLVDEFQDSSQARARLVRELVRPPGKYLLAVGDDWQAINRFAGADISIMTSFDEWFGHGPTLRLETTFRCPQEICDVSSHFVSKNPRQLSKAVVSAKPGQGPRLRLTRVPSQEAIGPAVEKYLSALARDRTPWEDEQTVTVDVLGRYGFDAEHARAGRRDGIEVRFRTVHGSKGLEADHIVIVRADNGRHGFPSRIADDPMLGLAMADPDPYPYAEERRLFYVALTRARREVVIITIAGRESPFVVELIEDGLVDEDQTTGGQSAPVRVCPKCRQGTLVKRSGPYGDFLGCSRFPSCRGTAQIDASF